MNIYTMLPVNNIVFPHDNMFWAKVDAIFQFFIYMEMNEFSQERGQINGTTSHDIERVWTYLAEYNSCIDDYC